jgi:hypothetical protein
MRVKTLKCKKTAVALCLLILMIAQFTPSCFAVSFDEASEAINQADRDLRSAFSAVAGAEVAGADVSVLLGELESAGDFLSEAFVAFRTGDYENASLFAMECRNIVEGISEDGLRLKANAESAQRNKFFLTAAGSGVGLVLLLVFGYLGWRFLKRWYFRRLLSMIPQVEGEQ